MSRPLGNNEGFLRERARSTFRCACGRGAPLGGHIYVRGDGVSRCVHCQIKARHSTMTNEESLEMLERIASVCTGADE